MPIEAPSVLDAHDHRGTSVPGRAPGEQPDPSAAQPQRMQQLDNQPRPRRPLRVPVHQAASIGIHPVERNPGLLRDLSTGEHRDDRDVNRMLADLGYTIAGPWRFAQVHASWRRPASPLSVRWRDEVQVPQARLYPAVRGICLQVVGAAAVVPWRSGFLMLLPAAPDNLARDLDVAADLLDRIHAAAEHVGPGARVHLAGSSPVRTARELGHGLHEAEQALELARRLEIADRPLAFEHLGVYRILLDGGGLQHRHDFVEDALGPLGRYDAEHGTAL